MKIRYVAIITALCFLAMLGYGLYQKTTYTNHNKEETPLEDFFYVGIFPDSMIDGQIDTLSANLDSQNYILAVRCNESVYFRFGCATQNVIVEKVYAGSDIDVGDDFDILVSSSLSEDNQVLIVNGKSSYLGTKFVNMMETGKVYLVFLDRKIENHDSSDPIYRFSDTFLIKPLFSYEEMESVPLVKETDLSDSVSYSTAKDNEFFLASQESIDKMIALKESFLAKYPLDE
jgi:hypothetical protein